MTRKNTSKTPSETLASDVLEQKNSPESSKGFDFEASLLELEKLVDALETGELSLEQSLQDFERGIHLTRACQNALTVAQQKVQILLKKNGQPTLEEYE